jgi:hypothetical protein
MKKKIPSPYIQDFLTPCQSFIQRGCVWGNSSYYFNLGPKYLLSVDTNIFLLFRICIEFSRDSIRQIFRENYILLQILHEENHLVNSNDRLIFEAIFKLYWSIFVVNRFKYDIYTHVLFRPLLHNSYVTLLFFILQPKTEIKTNKTWITFISVLLVRNVFWKWLLNVTTMSNY